MSSATERPLAAALLLLLAFAGCVDRTPAFVPVCDADAPTRMEVEVNPARMDPTLYAFEERGWSNVTSMGNNVAGADCLEGTRQARLFDWAGLKDEQETADRATGYVIALVLMAFVPLGVLISTHRGWAAALVQIIGSLLTYAFALAPFWFALIPSTLSVSFLVFRYTRTAMEEPTP